MKSPPTVADSDDEDAFLANSKVLTREEVLRRRARWLKRLARRFRDRYWDLMEDVRRKHREYYWKYGMSPFQENEERENGFLVGNVTGNGLSNGDHRNGSGDCDVEGSDGKLGLGFGGSFNQCLVDRCTSKAMPLTKYCHPHILLDSKQTLYKRCQFVFRSTESGAIQCSKPILRSTIPSLCSAHVQKTEKAIKQALRKGSISSSSSAKLASKFQCVISEYVGIIQNTRRTKARSRGNLKMADY